MNNWNSMKLTTLNCSCAKFSWENFCAVLTQIAKQFCVVIINQGGGVAAPVGGQVFSEILPYLEVNQGNTEEVEEVEQIETPDIVGKTIKEAESILKESGLELEIENAPEELDKENTLIKEQTPKAGIKVNKGGKIYITIE